MLWLFCIEATDDIGNIPDTENWLRVNPYHWGWLISSLISKHLSWKYWCGQTNHFLDHIHIHVEALVLGIPQMSRLMIPALLYIAWPKTTTIRSLSQSSYFYQDRNKAVHHSNKMSARYTMQVNKLTVGNGEERERERRKVPVWQEWVVGWAPGTPELPSHRTCWSALEVSLHLQPAQEGWLGDK